MTRPAQRHELGPMTLAEVLAARDGRAPTAVALADRPLIDPRDARAMPMGVGRAELRMQGDDQILAGYATVYDVGYEMYGGPSRYGWIETMVKGSGAKSLAESPDVVHLENHMGRAYGRTKSGTLKLSEDNTGLANEVTLAAGDTRVPDLIIALERRDVDEQSFAFRIIRQEWNEDYTERWITEYSIDRGDTSHVTFGANPHTSVATRGDGMLDPNRLILDQALAGLIEAGETDPLAALIRTVGRDTITQPNAGRSIRLARIQADLQIA